MNEHGHEDRPAGGLPPEVAEGMLEEAESASSGGPDDDDVAGLSGAAGEPEPGTIADTGQPAGTADAAAAGVMDTEDEDRR